MNCVLQYEVRAMNVILIRIHFKEYSSFLKAFKSLSGTFLIFSKKYKKIDKENRQKSSPHNISMAKKVGKIDKFVQCCQPRFMKI